MNDSDLIKRAMSILGSRKSEAKTAAARRNAKKPRKRAKERKVKETQ